MDMIKLSLKVLVNKETKKILFAEVEEDFVNFLFSQFSLPFSYVTSLLTNQNMVGSLPNLHINIHNLGDILIQSNRDSLQNP